jgi:hypothetical protein
MSLRTMLGVDIDRVHEQVDALLDSEDGMIVLIDGSRAVSYADGFGISPYQLESLMVDIERAVRDLAGPSIDNRRKRRTDGDKSDGSGRGGGIGRHLGRLDHEANGRVLTGELNVFGLVALATAMLASLLVVYFDWREKLRRRMLDNSKTTGRQ